ncbi:Pyruvate dehydrogenase E1 component [Leclercia adecarboxylata]|uniref:Pyruvate dehydrogenase E1 component n=1 Tax=Leclercia adecarboxylata TaxID=83655 RepID=A0A4U9HL98_9ENTR|nr:Pyruvate dehydrogenase E1 component [Leclercia adecarboxylata]
MVPTFVSTSSVKYPETAALVADWTDDQIWALNRGGHDPKKVYAALKKAQETKGKATVILAHTVKGYGMGDTAEGKNIAHQVKKMNMDGVRYIRDRFNVPVTDEQVENLSYITFPEGSEEHTYLHAQRQKLNGYLPSRQVNFTEKLELPALEDFSQLLEEPEQRDLHHYRLRACPERDAEEQVDQRSSGSNHR